jgi:hypothetical protein
MKTVLTFGLAAILAAVLAFWLVSRRQAGREAARAALAAQTAARAAGASSSADQESAQTPRLEWPTRRALAERARRAAATAASNAAPPKAQSTGAELTSPPSPPASVPAAQGKEPIRDPAARVALSFVGVDPDAEAYWVSAINDPGLSPQERQDLIEDLNEDGLSDPSEPGVEDLPLIVNRLQLIEELAPYAMDQVNADAFVEAYKDLAIMFMRLTGQ